MNEKITQWLARFNRACIVFLLFFNSYYMFGIPARASATGIMLPLDATFDILVAVAFTSFLIFAFLVTRYRITGIVSFVLPLSRC